MNPATLERRINAARAHVHHYYAAGDRDLARCWVAHLSRLYDEQDAS